MRRARRGAALAGAFAALLLVGCRGGPPVPQWRLDASASLEQYREAHLRGETRVATQAFERARGELASTGRAELVARAELTRCALQVASLDFDDCPGFAPLARDADAESRAYAAYIGGRWADVDAALLPAPHRAVFAGASGRARVPDRDRRRPPPACSKGSRTRWRGSSRQAHCFAGAASFRPRFPLPSKPPRPTGGDGRFWRGSACRKSGRKRQATSTPRR